MKTLQEHLHIAGSDVFHICPFNEAELKIIESAMKAAISEACREQREICAGLFNHNEDELLVKLIKNAPEPTLS